MSLRISAVIARLQAAQQRWGDLPLYLPDSDIGTLTLTPCRDGKFSTTDGVLDFTPNELVMEIEPCR